MFAFKTHMSITNPELSNEVLLILKQKLSDNNITISDLEKLDFFLGNIGLGGSILKKFQERGYDYQKFIQERKKSIFEGRDAVVDTTLYGIVVKSIFSLQDYLK